MTQAECIFCDIVAGRAPANIVRTWGHAIAIVPLNPVTEGHILVLPRRHVTDVASRDVETVERTMRCAAELIRSWDHDANLITSVGVAATQTVFHLHIHCVPRRVGDGLPLPWTPQHAVEMTR